MRYWKMFLFTSGLFALGVFIFYGIIMITEGYVAEAIILSIAGGLAFGLLFTLIMGLWHLIFSSKYKVDLKKGERVILEMTEEEAHDFCLQVLKKTLNIDRVMQEKNPIIVRTAPNFGLRGSWGEDVCCQIESISDHQTRVTITSKSVSKFAFVDSGINAQNVQKIVDIISS